MRVYGSPEIILHPNDIIGQNRRDVEIIGPFDEKALEEVQRTIRLRDVMLLQSELDDRTQGVHCHCRYLALLRDLKSSYDTAGGGGAMTDAFSRKDIVHGPGANLKHREIARRFFAYSSIYWFGRTRRIAWSFTLILLSVILMLVGTAVGINQWMGAFFNAIENKDSQGIFTQLWGILLLGTASAMLYGLWTFLGDRMKVSWRESMTDRLIDKWLESDHQKHHTYSLAEEIDSPEFRIAEDVRMSIDPLVDLATTFLNALASAFVFVTLLWKIGGSVSLYKGIILPGYMMWLAIGYAIFCSIIIRIIGDPIVRLTERKNASEAKLRGDMVRYGELPARISEQTGNLVHRKILKLDMDVLFSRWRRLAIYSGQVGALTQFNTIFMPIVPLLAVAPRYFDGDISLGAVVQVSTAFVSVQLALNWYFDHFNVIANWLSSAQRVVTLIDALDNHQLEGELKSIDDILA